MKARPILFTGAMVRAILDGSKTQTRRAVELPHANPLGQWEAMQWGGPTGGRTAKGETVPAQMAIGHSRTGQILVSPYGQPGDRLWVRESFMPAPLEAAPGPSQTPWSIAYAAGGQAELLAPSQYNPMLYTYERWTPSIHMPRWASRITLEITSVRVERLQDVSEADAQAEGIAYSERFRGYCIGMAEHFHSGDPRESFRGLWQSINGPDSWAANPLVWVLSFKKVTP